ncbi:MAG: adenosylcobalamin-dependent ribonucleoside-diphosphate reductase [Planctomycetota bacterium]|jgi:ribonucleoside-diphosphate reductase alpha chain
MAALTPNAIRVLERRYLRRDPSGHVIETPEALFDRVASAVAGAEAEWDDGLVSPWHDTFRRVMASLDFLPNSPTLMNAGTEDPQLSACFVLPLGEDLEAVAASLEAMALVQKTGGGTGFSFSRLPPAGDRARHGAGEAPGPMAVMENFDTVTETITRGGRRRGANMGILRADHPDILAFVRAKRAPDTLVNFNLSVGTTDAFMRAVESDDDWALLHPVTGERVGRLHARELFDEIVHSAWLTGDPGLVFLDAINAAHPTPALGAIEATNPCGEVPLLPFESCNLGSINLAHMLREEAGHDVVDWDRLRETARIATRFLDDAIEINRFPLAIFEVAARGNRKIGIGVMGWAELLIRLGLPYDSEQALALADRVMRTVAEAAQDASTELARTRGVYPNYEGSTSARSGPRVRNATRTAIAPTGTLSLLAGTTAGIEPLFGLAYRRSHVLGDEVLEHLEPTFLAYLEREGLATEDLLAHVREHGSLPAFDGGLAQARRLFATAHQIPWADHLAMQAAFQGHVDNAVSKTVNLPAEAREEDVAAVYRRAWALRLKGVTAYRAGSGSGRTLTLGLGGCRR